MNKIYNTDQIVSIKYIDSRFSGYEFKEEMRIFGIKFKNSGYYFGNRKIDTIPKNMYKRENQLFYNDAIEIIYSNNEKQIIYFNTKEQRLAYIKREFSGGKWKHE